MSMVDRVDAFSSIMKTRFSSRPKVHEMQYILSPRFTDGFQSDWSYHCRTSSLLLQMNFVVLPK